ncbi:MAG TPA: hypothetical protein VK978_01630 [Candidatus Saccharimonadales bacterium]|nr:hypothetical protein [Candidatus Saccharimonadales bacterium]
MTTELRLRQYYDFDDKVVHDVSLAALWQNKYSFRELADIYGIQDGPQINYPGISCREIQVMEFVPKLDHDEMAARMYHLPMGTAIGPNTAMRAIRMFGADPSERLILVGSPSVPGQAAGTLALKDIKKTIADNSLEPSARPAARFLLSENIRYAAQLGYWSGADKAAATATAAAEINIKTTAGVYIEPASIKKQNILALAGRFGASGAEPSTAVRDKEKLMGFVAFSAGLLRLSNIAVAKALAHGGFEERAATSMERNPGMHMTIGWGSASELVDDDAMQQAADILQIYFGANWVRTLWLEGMQHAGADDIDLHAAIMLQGLRY